MSSADIEALTDFSSARPWWVPALNRLLGPVSSRIRLDPDALVAAAKRRTGLQDFGTDDFWEPMQAFLRSLDEEAHLTPLGRMLARRDVMVLLCNRLKIAETFRRHPEIAEQEIREPLFIMGLPRSGTSILHELMAQDPAHRSLESWEARYPCPPPTAATYETDPRIRKAHFELRLWPRLVPPYEAMHEMGGRIQAECGQITANSFLGDHLVAIHQVPSYGALIAARDMRPAYEIHRKILQILQWKTNCERWVLKAPAHMNWLETLFDVYPDARIVQSHRDPLQVMGSTVSLIAAIIWIRAGKVDPELVKLAFGPAYYEPQLMNMMQLRESEKYPRGRFFDVRFQDLMADHFGVIRQVYDHFGWSYTEDAEQRMRTYLANKPRGKFGKHFYSFEDLGLDLATERARYAAYQTHYGVASEVE
jgi:hypothetical protein